MDTSPAVAAHRAQARITECRRRLAELADRRPVAVGDVHRARTALDQARERAETAHLRLVTVAERRTRRPAQIDSASAQPWSPAIVRQRARQLCVDELFTSYVSLGGNLGPLEVEAFVHLGLDLPPYETAVLSHAVWELAEL